MKTKGWVVKSGSMYWRNDDTYLTENRKEARVFLTKMCAFAARNSTCAAWCCRVYRLTSRPRKP